MSEEKCPDTLVSQLRPLIAEIVNSKETDLDLLTQQTVCDLLQVRCNTIDLHPFQTFIDTV